MMLPDVNVLIGAFRSEVPQHTICRSWLDHLSRVMPALASRDWLEPLLATTVRLFVTTWRISGRVGFRETTAEAQYKNRMAHSVRLRNQHERAGRPRSGCGYDCTDIRYDATDLRPSRTAGVSPASSQLWIGFQQKKPHRGRAL